ncbi:MAG: TerB family tellurite resistance protein [Pseudomonadota bacterium]
MWLESLSDTQRHTLLRLAHNVVVSDGILDPNEEGMMNEFRREMELNALEEPEYIEIDGVDQVFDTRQSRIIALLNLLKLSYADGAFEIEEECLLKEISQAFGLPDAEFQLLDNWIRRLNALEAEALDLM